jgi:hypothetical protein
VYTSHTTVYRNGGGGGGSSWLLPAFLGYYAGGGCNRDRHAQEKS